jgi:hypothetical protein
MLPSLLDLLQDRGFAAVPVGELLAPHVKILGPAPADAVG